MAMLYVLQSGDYDWGESKRLPSKAGRPLSDEQAAHVRQAAEELAELGIQAVLSSSVEPECQVAQIIAERLGLRPAGHPGLHEIDYGLWQGLLVGEIMQRHSKGYRQWREAPEAACPPGGEPFADASERMWSALCKIVKRHRGQNVLLVASPWLAALLDCRIMGRGVSAVWDTVDWSGRWVAYDLARIDILETAR